MAPVFPESQTAEMVHNTVAASEIYQPLDRTRREIRLMRMRHDAEDTITCDLQVFALDEKPMYMALSYEWKTEPPKHEILINGKSFYIRPNLYDYLKVMQAEKHNCWIFIDALCLNQEDEAEKSHLVSLMGDVYRNAQEVVAWIGANHSVRKEFFPDPVARETDDYLERRLKFDTLKDSDALRRITGNILLFFFDSSFWSRLWIVQEVVLSQNLMIRCGKFCLPAEEALSFLEFYHGIPFEPNETMLGVAARLRDSSQRQASVSGVLGMIFCFLGLQKFFQANAGYSIPITWLLPLCSAQQCTDWHDKIFGLLGMTRLRIIPNYSMPVLEVYVHLMIEGIDHWNEGMGSKDNAGNDTAPLSFGRYLAISLDLSPWDPAVAWITMTLFKWRVIDFWQRDLFHLYCIWAFGADDVRSNGTRIGFWTRKIHRRYKMLVLELRLQFARKFRSRLASPDGGEIELTKSEWSDIITQMYQRVTTEREALKVGNSTEKGRIAGEGQFPATSALSTGFQNDAG